MYDLYVVVVAGDFIVTGRFRWSHVASPCRQTAWRRTVYFLITRAVRWRQQADVRASDGAWYRLQSVCRWTDDDDDDSETASCCWQTLASLQWRVCFID